MSRAAVWSSMGLAQMCTTSARLTQLLMSVVEQPWRRLVGTGLLRGDHPVDVAAELRDVAGNDVVVGVGDDAQFETHGFQFTQGLDHLGKRRHFRDRGGQTLAVFGQARQAQFFQGHLQAEGA